MLAFGLTEVPPGQVTADQGITDACDESGNVEEGQGPPGVEQVFGPVGTGVTMPVSSSHTTGPMVMREPAGQAVLLFGPEVLPPTRYAYGTHWPGCLVRRGQK